MKSVKLQITTPTLNIIIVGHFYSRTENINIINSWEHGPTIPFSRYIKIIYIILLMVNLYNNVLVTPLFLTTAMGHPHHPHPLFPHQ